MLTNQRQSVRLHSNLGPFPFGAMQIKAGQLARSDGHQRTDRSAATADYNCAMQIIDIQPQASDGTSPAGPGSTSLQWASTTSSSRLGRIRFWLGTARRRVSCASRARSTYYLERAAGSDHRRISEGIIGLQSAPLVQGLPSPWSRIASGQGGPWTQLIQGHFPWSLEHSQCPDARSSLRVLASLSIPLDWLGRFKTTRRPGPLLEERQWPCTV